MPTTTRSRTQKSRTRTELEQHAAGLEALGLGIAPGLPGAETGEFVERAGVGAGQPRRGASAGHPPVLPPELLDEAVDRAADRRRVREALGMPSDRRISNEVLDELLAGASTEEELAGPGGVLAQLTKRLVERAMEVELTDHVGYESHQEPPGGAGNTRNGATPKTLITEHGKVGIDAPRDRDGSFAPKIVRKRQRRFQGFDDKILALYSCGLSTRDISAHLQEIYGVNVGRDLISRVTDGVMDDVRDWAKRPLEDIYPIVFLDCMVLKIRDGGTVQRRALYLALGVTLDGERDVLGMWFQESEGAKFWMQVL
jgi:putative transposase